MYVNSPWKYKDPSFFVENDFPVCSVQDLDCSVISALKGGLVELSGEDSTSSKSSFDVVDSFADPLDCDTEFQSKSIVDFFDNVRNEKLNKENSLENALSSSESSSNVVEPTVAE